MVESNALLKRRTSKGYRGFESLSLRHSTRCACFVPGSVLALNACTCACIGSEVWLKAVRHGQSVGLDCYDQIPRSSCATSTGRRNGLWSVSNYTIDRGMWPFGDGHQGLFSHRPWRLWPKALIVRAKGKGRSKSVRGLGEHVRFQASRLDQLLRPVLPVGALQRVPDVRLCDCPLGLSEISTAPGATESSLRLAGRTTEKKSHSCGLIGRSERLIPDS